SVGDGSSAEMISSMSLGNNKGYWRAIYEGCNSDTRCGAMYLLLTMMSLFGSPSPKSFTIRAATSDTVRALYYLVVVRSLCSCKWKFTELCVVRQSLAIRKALATELY
nr:hypothetical protein [Tanacetum cinerariifolium]